MASINVPYDVKNVTMTGSIIDVKIEKEWNTIVVKNRSAEGLLIYNEAETNYFTIPSGSSLSLGSFNFSGGISEDFVKLSGTSGNVAEILGYKRA